MPDISEKIWSFLGGAGGGASLIVAGFGYLKWLATRKDKNANAQNQLENQELNDSRRRVDAFSEVIYERWEEAQTNCDFWKNSYADLYYKTQQLLPHLADTPKAQEAAQKITLAHLPHLPPFPKADN